MRPVPRQAKRRGPHRPLAQAAGGHATPTTTFWVVPSAGVKHPLQSLVFSGGLWDGQELTSMDPPPEWISIGASGRYTRINRDAAAPDGQGQSTAYYVWAHKDAAISTPDR